MTFAPPMNLSPKQRKVLQALRFDLWHSMAAIRHLSGLQDPGQQLRRLCELGLAEKRSSNPMLWKRTAFGGKHV